MYWMDWLSQKAAVARLRRQLPRFVAYSDKAAITHHFSTQAAKAAMQEGEGVIDEMADELQKLIAAPNGRLKRNRFHRW